MDGHSVDAHAHKPTDVDNKATSVKKYINAVEPQVDQKECTQQFWRYIQNNYKIYIKQLRKF